MKSKFKPLNAMMVKKQGSDTNVNNPKSSKNFSSENLSNEDEKEFENLANKRLVSTMKKDKDVVKEGKDIVNKLSGLFKKQIVTANS
jgi:hypothetical protein